MSDVKIVAEQVSKIIAELIEYLEAKGLSNANLDTSDLASIKKDTDLLNAFDWPVSPQEERQLVADMEYVGRGLQRMIGSDVYSEYYEELNGYFSALQVIYNLAS